MSLSDTAINFILANENAFGYAILLVSSAVEYVFPPFPGDTVTLFGAFLIATRGWNFSAVLLSVTLGSIAGSCIDYYIGRGIGSAYKNGKGTGFFSRQYSRISSEQYDYLRKKFDRYGPMFIVLNRFMPGVRAFFFVVAGICEMNIMSVQLYNIISVMLWNLIIIGAGTLIGNNWEKLLSVFQTYSLIIIVLILVLLAVAIVLGFKRKNIRR